MTINFRPMLWKLSTLRTYFLRAHNNWFAYAFSLLNFITISFYLLIENLTVIPDSFRLRHYILLFVLIYTPLAILVGFLDLRKGTFRVEQKLARELSPIWIDVFDHLNEIRNSQKEILQLIEKE
ncbi:MAG: hypothetical protein ACXAB7_12710 [Candidatus Kariarchaeaceae archaeon]